MSCLTRFSILTFSERRANFQYRDGHLTESDYSLFNELHLSAHESPNTLKHGHDPEY